MNPKEQVLRDTLALSSKDDGRINLSIKAGAGAGKTTLLSYRICNQILEGVPLEQFVIITYTNAAATELRDKITSRLTALLKNGSLDESGKRIVQDALHNIELIQISTIHSFLLKILQENSFASKIVLDCRMLEDDEEKKRQTDFFNNWYERPETQATIQDKLYGGWIHEAKTTGAQNDVTHEVFLNMFWSMANVREEIVCTIPPEYNDLNKVVDEFIEKWLPALVRFSEVFNDHVPTTQKGDPKIKKECLDKINWITKAKSESELPIDRARALSKALLDIYKTLNQFGLKPKESFYNGTGPNEGDIYLLKTIQTWHDENPKAPIVTIPAKGKVVIDDDDIKKCLALFPTDTATLDISLIANTIRAARTAELVRLVRDAYQAAYDSAPTEISNDDILFRAEKLFSENRDILDKYRMKYSKIYVDEFQDTTRRQANIIKMLAEIPGSAPDENKLQADKLVVVGDAKQSIYRFTGAEIDVYNEMSSLMDSLPDDAARSVNLDYNFRSNEDIVDWVNLVFPRLMPVDPTTGASTYSSMETDWKITDSHVPHGVFYYEYEKEDIEDDPTAVANLIQRLVGHDYCCAEEYDQKTKTRSHRPLQYKDIMVITKFTTKMALYVKKFSEMNIPVDVQGKFKVTDDEVLWNFIILADYLAGPKNRKTRLSAAQVLKNIDVTRSTKEVCKEAEHELAELCKSIRKKKTSPAAIIQHLLSREDLFMEKSIDQQRVREYRIRLHQMTETCIRQNTGDLSELVQLMKEYMNNDVKRELPLEKRQDAVRLMNIHKAKGLTSQIVIIADRSNSEGCKYQGFRKCGHYYPSASYKYNERSGSVTIPSFRLDASIMETAKKDESAEAIRLQYVAATRAAQALIIMPIATTDPWFSAPEYRTENDKTINDWLKDVEPPKEDTPQSPTIEASSGSSSDVQCVVATDAKDAESLNLEALYSNCQSAPSELEDIQQISITPSELEDHSIKTGSDSKEYKEGRPYGNIFGLIMHRVYELMVGNYQKLAALSEEDREKCITRLINLASLENEDDLRKKTEDPVKSAEDYLKYLQPIMIKFFGTVLKSIMDEAAEVYTEYSFSFFVDEEEKAEFMKEFAPYFKIKKSDNSGADASDTPDTSSDDDVDPFEDDDADDSEENADDDSDGTKKGEETEETPEERNAKAYIMQSGTFAGKIWVNGQADLVVVRKDGTIKVYDYKSNKKDDRTLSDFQARLKKKYEGQLRLYRYAIAKSFSDSTRIVKMEDIETELIDLYL